MAGAPASHVFSSMKSLLSDVTASLVNIHTQQVCTDRALALSGNDLLNSANSLCTVEESSCIGED